MKKYLLLGFFLLLTTAAFASPPQDLKISYSAGVLTAKMRHPTIEPRDHYIRTIKVTVNGGEPQIFRYTFQKYASEFEADIDIALNPGDHVLVRAECKLGGSAEAELSIAPAEEADEQPEK